ncbi:MAG: sugar transferase [Clostridia bacterium]|nr:sugar transferase [Clostridia bacterium]
MYEKYFKRLFDLCIGVTVLLLLSWLFLILTVLGIVFMRGNPFFTQKRPGKGEKIFSLIKFRTMDNRKDKDGNLLPDEERLNGYGKLLRRLSFDELPEIINIIAGDMSFVGPRPLLVRDMVFMTPEQRERHTVAQGLTGLAQVNGRNCIDWETKLQYDLRYLGRITFAGDMKIVFKTLVKVLRSEDINTEGMATAEDFGDYLLREGKITSSFYEEKQEEAKALLKAAEVRV